MEDEFEFSRRISLFTKKKEKWFALLLTLRNAYNLIG